MNIKKSLVLAALLLLATLANAQNDAFCSFAGVWQSGGIKEGRSDSIGLVLDYSDEGYPRCRAVINGKDDTTLSVSVVDSSVFFFFDLGIDTMVCDTIVKIIESVGALKGEFLEVTFKRINDVFSPIVSEKTHNTDTVIRFSRISRVDCPAVKDVLAIPGIDDPSSTAFANFSEARYYFDYYNGERDSLAVNGFLSVINALQDSSYNEISDNDRNILLGLSYYHLMIIFESIPEYHDACAEKAVYYLPDGVKEKKYAKVNYYYSFKSVSPIFSFWGMCDLINNYDIIDSLDVQELFYLKMSYLYRSELLLDYLDDGEHAHADLKRASEIYLWNGEENEGLLNVELYLDSSCYAQMSKSYYNLAASCDTADSELAVGVARVYYERSLKYFKLAGVEITSSADAFAALSAVGAYIRLYGYKTDGAPEWFREAVGFIADSCYSEPGWISYQTSDFYATITMYELWKRKEYEKVVEFYDAVKGNLRFHPEINILYLWSLAYMGYSEEDLERLSQYALSLKTGESLRDSSNSRQIRCLKGINQMKHGHFDSAYDNVYDNETLAVDSLKLYDFITMMLEEKTDYRSAYRKCSNILISSGENSHVTFYRGYYLKRLAETDLDADTANLMRQARNDFRSVIDYEKEHDTIDRLPYAYYWLGMPDSALYWTEHYLRINAPGPVNLCAADIYCLLGDYKKAKENAETFIQYYNTPFSRALLAHDNNLHPIGEYIARLCADYAERDTSKVKHIRYIQSTTTVPVSFSSNGSMYVDCAIGDTTVTMMVDNGANYLHISRDLACWLGLHGAIIYSLGDAYTQMANGSLSKEKYVVIQELKIGDITLSNVVAAISDIGSKTPFLLGQNVLANFIMEVNPFKAQITLTKLDEIRE